MNNERTAAQIEASRNNGKLSRGPVTEEGKAISSQNAVQHGLLSSRAVLPGEIKSHFDFILNSALLKYEPEDGQELHMVHQLAMHQWRQLRIWATQNCGHAAEILSQTEASPDVPERDMAWRAWEAFKAMRPDLHCVELMYRYETSFENKFHRNRKELQRLKDKRRVGGKPVSTSLQNEPKPISANISTYQDSLIQA